MNRKILLRTIVCILLVLSLPFVTAAEIVPPEDFDEYDTGTSIVVNVRAYEPTIVTSNLLEDNDVPVYVYLAGTTLGNLLGATGGLEPLYGGIEIEKVNVRPATAETNDAISGNIRYRAPNKIEPDTLGFLTFNLKQLERGSLLSCTDNSQCDEFSQCDTGVCIPKEVNLTFNTEIFFDSAERLYSLSKTSLILPEDSFEDEWVDSLEEFGSVYSFFGGRGFVRANSVTGNTAHVTVYSNKDLFWPIIGAPRPIADLTLTKGEQSDPVDLGFTDDIVLRDATFRLTLTDVTDPAIERAQIRVSVGGDQSQLYVSEGSPIYPGSSWSVRSISQRATQAGGFEYTLIIQDKKGNTKTLTTTQNIAAGDDSSDLLNKVFYASGTRLTQAEDENGIFYDSNIQTISAGPVNLLDKKLEEFILGGRGGNLIVNYDPAVLEDTTRTLKKRIEPGDTLKQVLASTLPAGYFYETSDQPNTLTIKKFQSNDPCDRPDALQYGYEFMPETYQTPDNGLALSMLCTAVNEYAKVVANYQDELHPKSGESLVDLAYFEMGNTYQEILNRVGDLSAQEERGAKEAQLSAWQALADRDSTIKAFTPSFEQGILDLENELLGNANFGADTVMDNGKFVFVKLISVERNNPEDLSSAVIAKEGISSTYHVGDKMLRESDRDNVGTFNWYVRSISDSSVVFDKIYSEWSTSTEPRRESEVIGLDSEGRLGTLTFRVNEIDTKREAHITVTPGTGKPLRSSSNFSVHIPIEARGLKLNPDKIDDKIEKARKLQESLESIIDTLDKVVTYWNHVCLGVFAIVSIKSSFFSASAEARHDAIHGIDDQSGWSAFCQERSGFGREYATFDGCMAANAAAIQEDIAAAQDAQKSVESLRGSYEGQIWYDEITAGYGGSLERCQEIIGDEVFLDQNSLEEYAYLRELEGRGSNLLSENVVKRLETYDGTTEIPLQQAKQEACREAIAALDDPAYASELAKGDSAQRRNKEEEVATGVYQNIFQSKTSSTTFPESKTFPALNEEIFDRPAQATELTAVGKVFKGPTLTKFKVYNPDGSVEVEALTIEIYEDELRSLADALTVPGNSALNKDAIDDMHSDLKLINSTYTEQEKRTQIIANNGERYYITEGRQRGYTIYVGTPSYSTAERNEEYAEGAKFELYGSGEWKDLPYCIPYRDGDFIKVISYTLTNEIDTLQYWNVGPDGHLCTADDVLVQHQSELLYETATPNLRTLTSFANQYVRQNFVENEPIVIDSHTFFVSFGKSRATLDGAAGTCYDVMDPGDCKLLFNTCDPVMCPPSRFNLGGRWNVDNVVESGFIGSLVLGSQTGDVLPICLTGILSSLNYWNSMLEGYVECLETSKFEGETVGICDKIRSVYWCETAVREAAAIMGSGEGGLLDFLASRRYDADAVGGGEYLKFKSNLQNVQNSISFFTTEYASTAFAAFRGRSFEEVGGEICKQAIYARTPWFEDFMAQVTTPEDPNQFFASLTTRPFAPTQGLEAYQTYYHIYAGVNPNIENIVYSVYLQNSLTNEVYYVTEQCEGVSSSIELGEMQDQTIDCIAPEGFDKVCVVINGETQCGFGSVTTSFATDFLKDSLVADEVRRDISSEEQCVPSVPTASPSVSQVGSLGITENLPLPFQPGILQTGVQRVCAVDNPGNGQGNSGSWTKVGDCGEDEEGRYLGLCWLNEDSFSIQDAKKSVVVDEHLQQIAFDLDKIGLASSELWGRESSDENYIHYRRKLQDSKCDVSDKKSLQPYKDIAQQFFLLGDRTLEFDYGAAAQFEIAETYATAVESCGLEGRGQIEYTGIIYPEGSTSGVAVAVTDRVSVSEGSGNFEIIVSNLGSGDLVESVDGFSRCIANPDGTWTCSGSINIGMEQDLLYSFLVKDSSGREIFRSPAIVLTSKEVEVVSKPVRYTPSSVCRKCTGTLRSFAGGCDQLTCHEQERDCYLSNQFLTPCLGCGEIYDDFEAEIATSTDPEVVYNEMCGKLNNDETRCQSAQCYDTFFEERGISGRCQWNAALNVCEYSSSTRPVGSRGAIPSNVGTVEEDDSPHIISFAGENNFIVEDAIPALYAAAADFHLRTGNKKKVKISSLSRTLHTQSRLFHDNCLDTRDGICNPLTCNPAPNQDSILTRSGNVYTQHGELAAARTRDEKIAVLMKFGNEANCPHTTFRAVDVFCEGSGNFQADPYCMEVLTASMSAAGFCRINHEGWHFEWDEPAAGRSGCTRRADTNYISYRTGELQVPTENDCGLWDYKNDRCVAKCLRFEDGICIEVEP